MSPIDNPAVPQGSTVLVTGVNGFIGSHVADQFLQYGYKVRGTVRDTSKNAWIRAYFEKAYGPGTFELASVPDMTAEGAYDEVTKGVSAIAHVASVMSFDPDPNKVIPIAIAGAVNALKAAYAEPSVKRFVLTSSSSAVLPAGEKAYSEGRVVTDTTWSEDAVDLAWAPPPYAPSRSSAVYSASKVEAEQAIWRYHEKNQERRRGLVVNAVLPNMNFGKSLDPVNQGHPSTSGAVATLWQGVALPGPFHAPQYFIDVQDTGVLHVAAAVLPDVKSERIFGFAEPINWDKVLDILRKQNPEHKFTKNFAGATYPSEIKPRARAEQLLREMGRPGWTSLENSLLQNTEDLRATK